VPAVFGASRAEFLFAIIEEATRRNTIAKRDSLLWTSSIQPVRDEIRLCPLFSGVFTPERIQRTRRLDAVCVPVCSVCLSWAAQYVCAVVVRTIWVDDSRSVCADLELGYEAQTLRLL
jgi:hypothetical protein